MMKNSISGHNNLILELLNMIIFSYLNKISMNNYFSIFERNSISIFIKARHSRVNLNSYKMFLEEFFVILISELISRLTFSSDLILSNKDILINLIL